MHDASASVVDGAGAGVGALETKGEGKKRQRVERGIDEGVKEGKKVAEGCYSAKRSMREDVYGMEHSGYQEAMFVQTDYKWKISLPCNGNNGFISDLVPTWHKRILSHPLECQFLLFHSHSISFPHM